MLTTAGAAVSIFVFCIVASLRQGMDQIARSPEAERVLVVFQENRFCPQSSRLPASYADDIAELPGVLDVVPIFIWTNNCRASLDVVLFHGLPTEALGNHRALEVIAGDRRAYESRRDAALVGRAFAQRRGLAAGDTFSIGNWSVHVAGVFSSPSAAEENLIYTHLEFLQLGHGPEGMGMVTMLEVHLADHADAMAVRRDIDERTRSGPVATVTRLKSAYQTSSLSDLVDLIGLAQWLGFACVGLVLAIVGTTTLMSVQDRIKEHGMLQTLGLRPRAVFMLVISESVLLCLIGGLLGTALALFALGWSGLAVGAEGVIIAFRPSWELAAMGIAVSLAAGLAAGALPSWQAARTPILSALRES